jgi:Xaa-Pro aminopeptidase
VPAAGVVEAERAIKEPEEVAALQVAATLVDDIYTWVLERGLVGRTELDVAVALEHEMRLRGATGPSFPSIVASGEHGARPHAQPRDVEIPRDTLVTIDIARGSTATAATARARSRPASRRRTCWRPTNWSWRR